MASSNQPGSHSHGDEDPFATGSQVSEVSRESGVVPASSTQPQQHDPEVARTAQPAAPTSFPQRWRDADERAFSATLGRCGGQKKSPGGEKATGTGAAAASGRRKRAPAYICTCITLAVIIIVIAAIVVPVAVVYSHRNNVKSADSGSGDSSSSGGSGMPGSTPTSAGTPGSSSTPIPVSDTVSLTQGRYQGTKLPNGITQFLGMQYAAPPVKDLRFAAPQPPVKFTGTKPATEYGKVCHSLGDFKSSEDEDCLYLDVFTPSNTTTASKLPVFVFIQGGGLQTADSHFNGSSLITASHSGMITVTMTYRVNALGFLASSEIQHGGSLNNGLKDQRAAMHWVKDNIAAFGGDPNRITMAGESAGAGSGVMHLVAYGGRDDHIFQQSAVQSQPLQAISDVAGSQYQYDYIVGNTTCRDSQDSLTCLRNLPIKDLMGAVKNSPVPGGAGGNPVFPYNPVVDGDFLKERPVDAFLNGNYVKVPMIFGDDTDEGTIFVDRNSIHNQQDANNYLRNNYPLLNDTVLGRIGELYDLDHDTSNNEYWRRLASAYTDIRYICPGLRLARIAGSQTGGKAWNFHYDVIDPASQSQDLGVSHGSEMPAIWGVTSNSPNSYKTGNTNAGVPAVMQAYWTSFVMHGDPNVSKLGSSATWEGFPATGSSSLTSSGGRIHITADQTSMEPIDQDLAGKCSFLDSIATDIGQ